MKTYIDAPIIIHKKDLDDEEWASLCERFRVFEEKFVIFNSVADKYLVIKAQKISLEESDMASFLEVLYDYQRFSNIARVEYVPETDRIVVNIGVHP